jgi:hypothetical protein
MSSNSVTFTITDPELAAKVARFIAQESGKRSDGGDGREEHSSKDNTDVAGSDGRPFVGTTKNKRVQLPHGEKLHKVYQCVPLEAHIDDGAVVFNGKRHSHISAAAVAAAKTVNVNCQMPNGYKFWRVLRDGKSVPVDMLAD